MVLVLTFSIIIYKLKMNLSKQDRKSNRKQKKYTQRLFDLTGIKGCDEQTQYLMLGNAGLVSGLTREQLLALCLPFGPVANVIMFPGQSYCFVAFKFVSDAGKAFDALDGKVQLEGVCSGPFRFIFTLEVPAIANEWIHEVKPPGLLVINDFITENEEHMLLNLVKWKDLDPAKSMKHRRVAHYGYEFRYDINNVDLSCPLPDGLPIECNFVADRLNQRANIAMEMPNQLTVNEYQPGQGIPSHIDTHSAFEDPILSLSLGSEVVMDFKNVDGRVVPVRLPARSLLVMTNEARYAWSHGIAQRKSDTVPTPEGGVTVQPRGVRTSFTFRRVLVGECSCDFKQHCDSQRKGSKEERSEGMADDVAARLESTHVHQVYEEIASHFSETRHKPWPNVTDFVNAIPSGGVLIDVGCGNGKYFGNNNNTVFELGCDRSVGLAKVCSDRGFQVFNCNCLALPLRSNVADGCISIAVIHHLATKERRVQAVAEMVRVLRPGGRALIYVWAKDQARHKTKSTYLKQDRKNRREASDDGAASGNVVAETEVVSWLPVHTNRTQFQHQDVLVPWKVKPTSRGANKVADAPAEVPTFLRYYHVFEEAELEEMCATLTGASIVKSFYDQGNWCVILEKLNDRDS